MVYTNDAVVNGVDRNLHVQQFSTADALDSHHNHTLGKFLVTFGDVQSTDELVGKLAGQGADSQPVRALAGAK